MVGEGAFPATPPSASAAAPPPASASAQRSNTSTLECETRMKSMTLKCGSYGGIPEIKYAHKKVKATFV